MATTIVPSDEIGPRPQMLKQPDEIPLFPLETVLFPKMVIPLHIFEERYKEMIGRCLKDRERFGICLIETGTEAGPPAIPHTVGTTAEIMSHQYLDEGRINLTATGRERFRIAEIVREQPYITASVEWLPGPAGRGSRIQNLAGEVKELFKSYMALLLLLTSGWTHDLDGPEDPLETAYYVAARMTTLAFPERQELLKENSLEELLRQEIVLLHRDTARLRNIATLTRRGH
ncbi:MAG: LON peptidase substrate-binding domain-containing protein [Armatimonadetes bacterium]|nr:LON peptidase substrate-binding domain-containing protein [Armatimonadota bacterium]